jgi:hypothetical protein
MPTIISEPSICIPRALANVTWKDVKDIFEQVIGAGSVERVDLVRSKDDEKFCRIFVHIRSWPVDKPEIADMRNKLLAGETIKLVYDNPWFWKCVKSRIPKPERTKPRQAPFIATDESSEPPRRLRTLDDFVEDDRLREKRDHGTPSPDEWRCDSRTGQVRFIQPKSEDGEVSETEA